MVNRKFSTGTKGRVLRHAVECKNAVLQRCGNEALAAEFIAEIDPDRNDKTWQIFPSPLECLNKLEAWLDGVAGKQEPPQTPNERIIMSALAEKLAEREEARFKKSEILSALNEVRNWAQSPEGTKELEGLSPTSVAKYILGRVEIILIN